MITTVFFDLDETLLDDERTALAALTETCRWAGEQRPGLDVDLLRSTYQAVNHSFWHSYDQRRETRTGDEIRHAMWLEGLTVCAMPDADFAEELSQTYHAMRDKTYALFDDAMPCLTALRPHYTLGLLTNGASSLQRAKVNALGLEAHVDYVVVAGEVGISKPDAGIFHHALSLAGCEPREAAMVGDLLDRDILGAMNAGLLPVWINRHGELGEEGEDGLVPATARVNRAANTPPPSHVIASLQELPDLLASAA